MVWLPGKFFGPPDTARHHNPSNPVPPNPSLAARQVICLSHLPSAVEGDTRRLDVVSLNRHRLDTSLGYAARPGRAAALAAVVAASDVRAQMRPTSRRFVRTEGRETSTP